jgi:Zn-dependent M28 family amino/carboxypeptidase
MGAGLTIILLILAWGLGLNLSIGRLLAQSPGAVDNGAACAILLGLAHELARGEFSLKKTRVTVALFTGEEINMQGSRAYVMSKAWDLPAVAVNLEAMAQNGDYVLWQQDGSIFKLESTSLLVNQSVARAVRNVTRREALPAGPVISDGSSFLAASIPMAVLGTYDRHWVDSGFHRPTDNLSRVVLERLPEGVEILKQFLLDHDKNT